MVQFFSDHNLSKNVERAYDAEHTTRTSEKKRKQGMGRKVSSQVGFS